MIQSSLTRACSVWAVFIFSATGFAADAPGKHLFILSGQSNMTGALSSSFTDAITKVFGAEDVTITMLGRAGQPIRNWDKDWIPPEGFAAKDGANYGQLYTQMMAGAMKSLKDSKPATVTLIWMQGEQDTEGTGSVYAQSFKRILARMKSDLGVDEIHFVVGRINDFWLVRPEGKLVRETLVKLAEEKPNGAWIDTDDLNRGVNPWGGFSFSDGHFPPHGYEVMGKRFAAKATALIAPGLKPDPAIFAERFIDSHEDIKTHAAIGKTMEISGADLGGEAAVKLLDGKYGKADHSDPAWKAVPPTGGTLSITIDLGEVVTVDSIGVNFLLDQKAALPVGIVFKTSENGKEYKLNNSKHNQVSLPRGRKIDEQAEGERHAQSVLILSSVKSQSPQKPTSARYVKIEITCGKEAVYIDEVVVNPER